MVYSKPDLTIPGVPRGQTGKPQSTVDTLAEVGVPVHSDWSVSTQS